jgi:hypothetical protein
MASSRIKYRSAIVELAATAGRYWQQDVVNCRSKKPIARAPNQRQAQWLLYCLIWRARNAIERSSASRPASLSRLN